MKIYKYFAILKYWILILLIQKNNIEEKEKYYRIEFISKEILNNCDKKYFIKYDNIFDQLIINKQYIKFAEKAFNEKNNEILRLKKSYLKYPLCLLKRNYIINENKWTFINIYNNYFCSCKGLNCLNVTISQICKYLFYLNIIDDNRKVYQKTDYLFIDFIFNIYSSDDVYPIFREMSNKKLPVHYITENLNIYKKYCFDNKKCLSIILVNRNNYIMNGDFLEKYLKLYLQLKAVISGGGIYFNYINNIFYNIEYITYISVGHGISYLKHFLYANLECYGHKKYDKILIPPSNRLISIVKMYGWKYEDIIKINLPRWEKYNTHINNLNLVNNIKNNNNSIFVMFTWRELRKNKEISTFYFNNIWNLLGNDRLEREIKKNNITLYFTLHHKLNNYKNKLKLNKYIHYIEENNISDCLNRTSLIVTDFSSIIFDLMYRKKPFIIFIPDSDDPHIENLYSKRYYELIQSIKNGTFKFENKYFSINETVNKILYYINNNFNLDIKLEKFYDSFELKNEDSINLFIKYLKHLKWWNKDLFHSF